MWNYLDGNRVRLGVHVNYLIHVLHAAASEGRL